MEGHIEAYNLPQGHIPHVSRHSCRQTRYNFSSLGTFVDPRLEGGKINGRTKEDIVRLIDTAISCDGSNWSNGSVFSLGKTSTSHDGSRA
jgi:acyl CoA:acetate/3-ketoacid CoA transferase